MKILVYGINYAPELTGIGKYSGEMCEWLAASGHEVRMVTAPPYYPAWQVDAPYSATRYQTEQLNGLRVLRCPLWVPKKIGGLSRILHLLSFALTSLPVMLAQAVWRPDVVMTVAPALTCAPAGWLTAKLCGAKSWLHIQDFEVDVAFKMGLLKGQLLRRLVMGLERFILQRFDCVSTISHRMVELLHAKQVAASHVFYFLNWANTEHIRMQQGMNSFHAELAISANTKVVLFSGTLNRKQGLEVIPRLAQRLAERKDILFVIGGEGALKAELEVASVGLKNIKFLPLQPLARLSDLLGLASIHLLPQNTDAEDLVLPSKLTGMLASGRPVVAICKEGSEISNVVVDCGLIVPPDDEAALVDAITRLADDDTLRLTLGQSARNYAEAHLSIEHTLNKVLIQMQRMLGKNALPIVTSGKS